ncbi:DUF1194 domain-containing protein [Denitromonas halophila]|uniref:DUF1194 domain-containing protein n=1 Tax=Denitromonas halophila TaxID=1629404 RepID=A0A557QT65_9RHOO|nr:DUF1194 domain-containing protein [Denitromonas halophila]TVO56108.1 DUF1194 domain-containing protein [Denitromonas halophila]
MKSIKKIFAALAFSAVASTASAVPVDLGLSLVIDVSGSVDTAEYNLQMDGYANAFRSAAVQSNILGGTNGQIGVNVVFFDSNFYSTSLDAFTILDSTSAINAFADILDVFARPGSGGTSIYTGTNRAVSLLTAATSGIETTNMVIDVSGDGTSSSSSDQAARNAAAALNITINGLAIEANATSTSITNYYTNNVVTGDGFVETAADFSDFQRAVENKLRIETAPPGNQIPLPGTLALLGLGMAGLAAVRKRS